MFTFLEGCIKTALRMWFHAEGGLKDFGAMWLFCKFRIAVIA